jgi:hypothetical protein
MSLVFSSAERFRKKAQIRGLFALMPKAVIRRKVFLATQELQSGQLGPRMKFPAQIKPELCVFGEPVYSHGCAPFQCITSKHMSSEGHVMALGVCGMV